MRRTLEYTIDALGSRAWAWVWVAVIAWCAGVALYAWHVPVNPIKHDALWVAFAAMISGAAMTCSSIFSAIHWVRVRDEVRIRLAPGAIRAMHKACATLIAAGLLSGIVALVLRVADNSGRWAVIAGTVAWQSPTYVPFVNWLYAALWLLHIWVITFLLIGPLRVPVRFGWAMIYSVPLSGSTLFSLIPVGVLLVACVWRLMFAALPTLRRSVAGETATTLSADQVGLSVVWKKITTWRWKLPSNGSAHGLDVLLSHHEPGPRWVGSMNIVLLACLLVFMWGQQWVVILMSMTYVMSWFGAISLRRVWLLPVGANRYMLGEAIHATWMRYVLLRVGSAALLACAALVVTAWGRPDWLTIANPYWGSTQLTLSDRLFNLVCVAVACCGFAYSASRLSVAFPRLLGRVFFKSLMPNNWMVVVFIVGQTIVFALYPWTRGLVSAARADAFAIVLMYGLLLPALTLCLSLALRSNWRRVDLGAIAATMERLRATSAKS